MKYCTKCKLIADDGKTVCTKCGKKLISNPNHYSAVKVITANGFELERIRAAFTDSEISFSVQQTKNDTGLQILNSAPPENCDVFVPISDYNEAVSVLVGIGAIKDNNIPEIDEQTKKDVDKARQEAEDNEMSPRKRFWVKLLSFLGFLLIIAAVTYFSDYIGSLIKQLFGW